MRPGPERRAACRARRSWPRSTHSLRRLGTDYVDLYQIHRWDDDTPIEETLEALHDVVKAGKARYIGASSMYAWQFAKALCLAEQHGWTRFVSHAEPLQPALPRGGAGDDAALRRTEGIGVIPWSPLARGRLTRDWDARDRTQRARDEFGRSSTLPRRKPIAGSSIASRRSRQRGVPRAQIALAWMLGKPFVTAPIIGATKLQHLDDAIAALDVKLDATEIAALEEPYVPHAVAGL